jgi:lysophospholipase L1-like esterase
VSSESAPHLIVPEGDAQRGLRPAGPEPFLRGAPWPGTRRVPYPRANPIDRSRIPGDTWMVASLPVGVRLEVVGDAAAIEIDYRTTTDQLGYRGDGAGTGFSAWNGTQRLGDVPAVLGEGTATLPLAADGGVTTVYLPEGMQPWILEVRGVGGGLAPAPDRPRWVVYGDSVAEGWIASEPALAWPAIAGREHGLDHVNLGYAGAARGELATAEQVGKLRADVLTVAHGTNCWTRTPHSVDQVRADTDAFLTVLRQEHPSTPIVVVSPVVRPDAEATPNRLGATLADLRAAIEGIVEVRMAAGDDHLTLVPGLAVLPPERLGDGIHPDDDGHHAIAHAVGRAVIAALGREVAGDR